MKTLYGLVAVFVLGCSSPQQASSPSPTTKKPAEEHSIVGTWILQGSSSKDYTEGLAFDNKGRFMRWGREPEGGWSSGGNYVLSDRKIQFSSKDDSPWVYGDKEFSTKGEADITWRSDNEFQLISKQKTESFKRVPEPKAKS